MKARIALGAFVAAGLILAGGTTLRAQSGASRWRQDDRRVIGDFSHVTAIAAGLQGVFVASPAAIVVWQPTFRRWEGPFEAPTPDYLRDVFAAIVDPLDQSLWLVEANGWIHFQPGIQLWDRGATSGRVVAIAFDGANPAAGLFLRTTGGWFTLSRGSGIPTPAAAPRQPERAVSIEEALRANPTLQSNSSVILQTAGLGRARFTAAAESPDGQGWYVGTDGAGLFFLPLGAAIPDPIPLGLPAPRASALFAAPEGVWVATDESGETLSALTYLGEDLNDIHSVRGTPAFGLRFHRARRLIGHRRDLWVATDIGVVRVPRDEERVEILDQRNGLPDQRVFGLAVRQGTIAVGTAAGIAVIDDAADVHPVATAFSRPAYAMALHADTIFVGTDLGVWYAFPASPDLVLPAGTAETARYRVPILDLVWMGDTLVAVTEAELLTRTGSGGWSIGPDLSVSLGELRRAVADARGLWVAGERGVGFVQSGAGVQQLLRVGSDLPGVPLDLAVQGRYLWVGTTAGVVRWRLAAIRP